VNNFRKTISPTSNAGLLTLLFFLSSIIWSFVTPLGASPDEGAHVQYASVIHQGKFFELKNSGLIVDLPENVAKINDKELCFYQQVDTPSLCYIQIDSKLIAPTEVSLRVHAYPPFYYAIVGLPLQFGFSNTIWHSMRFISAVLSTAVFGLAIFSVKRILTPSLVYAILLAATPLVSFLVGSVTPSSLEIVSGISLGLVLLAYPQLKNLKSWGKQQTIAILAIATVLSISRPYSWLAFGIIILSIYIRYISRANPIVIFFSLFGLLATALGMIILYLKSGMFVKEVFSPPALPHQILEAQFSNLDNYIYDSVGYFGWIMSYRGLELIHILWVSLVILLVIWSIQISSLRERVSLLFLYIS
jgi:hypothetical protein